MLPPTDSRATITARPVGCSSRDRIPVSRNRNDTADTRTLSACFGTTLPRCYHE